MDVAELAAREAIRELLADYHLAGDRGRLDTLLDCFTEDAVLEIEGEAPLRGRVAIEARLRGAAGELASQSTRPLLRHHLTTTRIEIRSDTEASAHSYFFAVTEIGPDHSGRYADRLRREAGRWRLAQRQVRVDWIAPGSRFPSAHRSLAARH
jgi:ketosteroid isomerase-like protein